MKWARKNRDYSNSGFSEKDNPKGGKWTKERRDRTSILMKIRWANGLFTPTTFRKKETSLERVVRQTLEKLEIPFKSKWWLAATGWRPKEYDFFLPDSNLLIEVDGKYWHSLPENVVNDEYKNKFAAHMNYSLLRIPEERVSEDAIRAAIADWKKKQG